MVSTNSSGIGSWKRGSGFPIFSGCEVAKLQDCSADLVSWEQGAVSWDSPGEEDEGPEED